MKPQIDKIDEHISEDLLRENGLTIENIVGTLDLNNEFDLVELSRYLSNTEYEPETHPFLVYRPNEIIGTTLIPTNGKCSLVGCKSKAQLERLGDHLVETLSSIVVDELPGTSQIIIQNIVVQGDIGHELELPPIAVLLGLENAEYEPEQFPGVIYRPDNGTTILIFGSGKYMINGASSYSQALSSVKDLIQKFKENNVPGDYD